MIANKSKISWCLRVKGHNAGVLGECPPGNERRNFGSDDRFGFGAAAKMHCEALINDEHYRARVGSMSWSCGQAQGGKADIILVPWQRAIGHAVSVTQINRAIAIDRFVGSHEARNGAWDRHKAGAPCRATIRRKCWQRSAG